MKIEIRGFILDNMKAIRSMMLTRDQELVVRGIWQREKYHGMKTSAFDLSVETEISIINASTKLWRLYKAGWLKREKKQGNTYLYYTDF